jgi:hypothetical protein
MTAGIIAILFIALMSEGVLADRAPITPGAELDGLRLEVSTDRSTYRLGEPVRVRLRWTNLGAHSLTIPAWWSSTEGQRAAELRADGGDVLSFAFEVYGTSQAKLPYVGVIGCGPDQGRKLDPGEISEVDYSINDGYDLSAPGHYAIRVTFAGYRREQGLLFPQDAWKGLIRHPDVVFKILQ